MIQLSTFLANRPQATTSITPGIVQQRMALQRFSKEASSPALEEAPSFSFSQSQRPSQQMPSQNVVALSASSPSEPSLSLPNAQYALQLASRKIMEALSALLGPKWVLNLKLKATQQTPTGEVTFQSNASSAHTIMLEPSSAYQSSQASPPPQRHHSPHLPPLPSGLPLQPSFNGSDNDLVDDSTEALLAQVAQLLQQPRATASPVMALSSGLATLEP